MADVTDGIDIKNRDYIIEEVFTTMTPEPGDEDQEIMYHSRIEGRDKETNALYFEAEGEGRDEKEVRKSVRLGIVHALENFWGVKPAA